MTYKELVTLFANGTITARGIVQKLSRRWYVKNIEQPGELLHGPDFKTRLEAEEFARKYIAAVMERLKEERCASKP